MKESAYNVYLMDEKGKEGLVFNTMCRSIVQIDNEVYSLIKENRIDEISDDVLDVLEEGKIVVDDNMNELEMLKIMFNRAKFNPVNIGFTMILTHACNLACKYCYQGHGSVLSDTMSEETLKRTIEFIKKQSEERKKLAVNFYGGEPLLYPDMMFRIIDELKAYTDENNMEFSISITSNCTLFTDEIAERLKEIDHEVQLTLSGPKRIHDKIRVDKKGNGTYDRLMDILALFKRHGIKHHIRVDVDRNSFDAMDELLDDLLERGYGGLYLGFCPIGQDVCYAEMEVESEEVDPAELSHLSKKAHERGFKTNPIYIHNFIEGCSAILDSFLAVDPKGDVYKCIAAPNYTEHRFGTIDDKGELANMNYEAYCNWTLRDPLRIKECVPCKFSPICAGGCTLTAYALHGSVNSPGCKSKENLGEILRTFIMLRYPELFEERTYETIIL